MSMKKNPQCVSSLKEMSQPLKTLVSNNINATCFANIIKPFKL